MSQKMLKKSTKMTKYQEKFSFLWNDITKLQVTDGLKTVISFISTTELKTDDEKDNDEENDGFFVPHGYLSSDEEQNDNG